MSRNIGEDMGLAVLVGLAVAASAVCPGGNSARRSGGRGRMLAPVVAFGAGAASGYAMAKGTPLSYDGPLLVGTPLVMGVAATMGASMGGYEGPGSAFPKAAGKAAFGEVLGYGAGYLAGWL